MSSEKVKYYWFLDVSALFFCIVIIHYLFDFQVNKFLICFSSFCRLFASAYWYCRSQHFSASTCVRASSWLRNRATAHGRHTLTFAAGPLTVARLSKPCRKRSAIVTHNTRCHYYHFLYTFRKSVESCVTIRCFLWLLSASVQYLLVSEDFGFLYFELFFSGFCIKMRK